MPKIIHCLQLKRHRDVKFVNRQNLTVTHNSPGFTLIELLVVIALIGILVVIVVVAINPVERIKSARDVVRMTDVDGIAKRLMVYRLDNGQFPASDKSPSPCWDNSSGRGWEIGDASNPNFINDLKIADNKDVPTENWPITSNNFSPEGPEPNMSAGVDPLGDPWDWSECNYRYMRVVDFCLFGTPKPQTWAIIYTWLETPSGEKDTRPKIFDTCPYVLPNKDKDWDESAPGTKTDKYDWAIFMLE